MRSPDRPPLKLTVGDEVREGDRDAEWPEFVFVTAAHGGTGWVPARHPSQPAGPATMQTAYDTTELATQVGDVLEFVVEDVDSGWLWCRSGTGRAGLASHHDRRRGHLRSPPPMAGEGSRYGDQYLVLSS